MQTAGLFGKKRVDWEKWYFSVFLDDQGAASLDFAEQMKRKDELEKQVRERLFYILECVNGKNDFMPLLRDV